MTKITPKLRLTKTKGGSTKTIGLVCNLTLHQKKLRIHETDIIYQARLDHGIDDYAFYELFIT